MLESNDFKISNTYRNISEKEVATLARNRPDIVIINSRDILEFNNGNYYSKKAVEIPLNSILTIDSMGVKVFIKFYISGIEQTILISKTLKEFIYLCYGDDNEKQDA